MKKLSRLTLGSMLWITSLSCCMAAGPIVTSDGPDHSQSASSSSSATAAPVVSDGPNTGSQSRIIISNGPAKPAYQYPLPIVISNGPSQLPYDYRQTSAVSMSDGPETSKAHAASPVRKHKIEVSDGPHASATNSEANTAALAPAAEFSGATVSMNAAAEKTAVAVPSKKIAGSAVGSAPKYFYVYSDKRNSGNHFFPSGWMGDYKDIRLNESSTDQPHSGKTCIQVSYNAKGSQGNNWAGIYWQSPANNWGETPGGYDLSEMHKLVFWARGEKGGEVISDFKLGGISGQNGDSDSISTGSIVLKKQWQKYTIKLAGHNLSHIIGGFCWSASRDDNPKGMTFYLDDIRYE